MKASLISAALMSSCLALVGIRATIPTFTSLQVDTKKLRKTDNDTQLQQNRYRIGGGWTHCWEDRKMDQLIVMIVYVRNNTNLLLRLKSACLLVNHPIDDFILVNVFLSYTEQCLSKMKKIMLSIIILTLLILSTFTTSRVKQLTIVSTKESVSAGLCYLCSQLLLLQIFLQITSIKRIPPLFR